MSTIAQAAPPLIPEPAVTSPDRCPARNAEPPTFWGDRLGFAFWIGCALLIVGMHFWDLARGLLSR